jgi:hypothetical protein
MTNQEHEATSRAALRPLGRLSLEIEADSLRRVVSEGRLLEFAGTVANEAAAQISAQIVDRLAEAAISGNASGGMNVSVAFIFEGGDFGTVPPRPKWGILRTDVLTGGLLRQLAMFETRIS